jgi:uncharacterized protein YggU (UPF0235/DUF167 family)
MKIFVRVKTKAREEKVKKIDDINFTVWVRQVPEKGKANLAIIKALADYFDVNQSAVEIISGSTSNLKIINIIKGRK